MGEDRGSDHGEKTADYNGKTAHRAFDRTDFHRLCSSDRMGAGPDCYSFGYGFLDSEQHQDAFSYHIADHTGDHDDNHGQGNIASKLFRHTHADSSGDRLREEGDIGLMVEPEEESQEQDAHKTRDDTRNDSGQDCLPMLLEKAELLVERYCQADCSRRKEVADLICPRGIGLIAESGDGKEEDNQND